MSTQAHTPGPWTVEEYGDPDAPALVIHSDHANRVCFMATAGNFSKPAEIETNARLIAAAPEMLAAGKKLAAFASNIHPTAPSVKSMNLLNDAIDAWDRVASKAEGRS